MTVARCDRIDARRQDRPSATNCLKATSRWRHRRPSFTLDFQALRANRRTRFKPRGRRVSIADASTRRPGGCKSHRVRRRVGRQLPRRERRADWHRKEAPRRQRRRLVDALRRHTEIEDAGFRIVEVATGPMALCTMSIVAWRTVALIARGDLVASGGALRLTGSTFTALVRSPEFSLDRLAVGFQAFRRHHAAGGSQQADDCGAEKRQ